MSKLALVEWHLTGVSSGVGVEKRALAVALAVLPLTRVKGSAVALIFGPVAADGAIAELSCKCKHSLGGEDFAMSVPRPVLKSALVGQHALLIVFFAGTVEDAIREPPFQVGEAVGMKQHSNALLGIVLPLAVVVERTTVSEFLPVSVTLSCHDLTFVGNLLLPSVVFPGTVMLVILPLPTVEE